MENGFNSVGEPIVSIGSVQFRHGQDVRIDVVGKLAFAKLFIAPDTERHLHVPHGTPEGGGILFG
jgi:hypothetical protein